MDLIRLHGDTGAVIFGTVTSINCFIVVLFTPLITQILKRSSEPKKTIYGFLLTLVGYVMFILFSGHIPFYYAAMVVLTWGEISYMLAESPYDQAYPIQPPRKNPRADGDHPYRIYEFVPAFDRIYLQKSYADLYLDHRSSDRSRIHASGCYLNERGQKTL